MHLISKLNWGLNWKNYTTITEVPEFLNLMSHFGQKSGGAFLSENCAQTNNKCAQKSTRLISNLGYFMVNYYSWVLVLIQRITFLDVVSVAKLEAIKFS